MNIDDFANNPANYNGRTIVLRGVTISKNTASALVLNGPKTTSAQSPTGALKPSGGAIASGTSLITPTTTGQTITLNSGVTQAAAAPTTVGVRAGNCTPPRNWEILNVEIPNYQGCFMIYNNMAKSIPNGRKATADITIFVDTNLMHRIVRVKLI